MLQSNLILANFCIITSCLLLFSVANPEAEGLDCPTEAIGSQWSFYEGPAGLHPQPCYAYHRKDLDWWASVDTCREATGGHLVTQRAFLDDWNGPWDDFWIDGWKKETEWEWIDGVKLGSFSRWKSNPDSLSRGDCAYLEATWPQREFIWVQKDCSSRASFICQTTTDNANCSGPLHTISFEGFCFIFFCESLVTWYEARALCRARGANLAVIQLREIYEMFEENFRLSGPWEDGVKSRETFWIGLRKSKWISTNTGDEIPLSLWGSDGPPATGQCAFAVAQVGLSTVTLYGSPCNATRRFVCEINSTKVFETALGLAGETQSSSSMITTPGENSSATNIGQIVGLVVLIVLVIVGIGLLVLLSVCLWRRFHLKPSSNQPVPRVFANDAYRRPTHELFCTWSSLHPTTTNTLTNHLATDPTLTNHLATDPTLTNHLATDPTLTNHLSTDPTEGSTLTPFENDKGSNMAKEESTCVEGYLEMNAQSLVRNDEVCVQKSFAAEAKPLDRNDAVGASDDELPSAKYQNLDLPPDIFSAVPLREGLPADVSRRDILDETESNQGLGEKSPINEDAPSKLNLGQLELGGMTEDISFA